VPVLTNFVQGLVHFKAALSISWLKKISLNIEVCNYSLQHFSKLTEIQRPTDHSRQYAQN